MNTNKAAAVLICVLGCADLSCVKIKSSGLVVPVNFHTTLTVSAGGTLRFVSQNEQGAFFKVHFTPPLGCNGSNDDLTGTPTHAAVCKVPVGSEGLYAYTITPLDTGGGTSSAAAYEPPPPPGYVTVDHCKGCDWKSQKRKDDQKLINVPAMKADDPPTVLIVCNNSQATAQTDPVTASSGQAVLWSQLGPDRLKWTATVPDGICSNGKSFGTVDPATPQACIIDKNAPLGNNTYRLTLTGCSAGSATLTVK